MIVVFLGDFDTPTPEVVACKTSGSRCSGYLQVVQAPLIKFIYLEHLIKKIDMCNVVSSPVFYRDTITRQAASQGWRPPSGHKRFSYTPSDAIPVFQGLGILFLLLLLTTDNIKRLHNAGSWSVWLFIDYRIWRWKIKMENKNVNHYMHWWNKFEKHYM